VLFSFVIFDYKHLFRRAPLRPRSGRRVGWDDRRGSCADCFEEIAGGTPATTQLLRR